MIASHEPLYITIAYFPNDIFPMIDQKYLADLSFTKIVEDHFHLQILKRKRILRPDIPDQNTIKILEMKKSEKKAIFYLQTFWTVSHKGLERTIYFEEYFKSSKSCFVFES
jgi:DNA-binding GntR family transcriptional regulator